MFLIYLSLFFYDLHHPLPFAGPQDNPIDTAPNEDTPIIRPTAHPT